MAQSSGYGAGSGSVDVTAGVTGGTGTTGTTGDGGSSGTTDQAKEKVSDAAGQAKQQAQQAAGQAAGQAKGALRNQVDSRSTQAGQQVKQQASDVRSVAEQLREQGKDGPAKVAEQAADRVERIGDYLHQSDADRIIDDIERFARSNPWVVLAGGLTTGFLAARALKASSSERYQAGGASARRQQLPPAGGTTGRYTAGIGGSGSYVGGGITGAGSPTPPASSLPPVRDPLGTPPAAPGGSGVGTPPAGGI